MNIENMTLCQIWMVTASSMAILKRKFQIRYDEYTYLGAFVYCGLRALGLNWLSREIC